MTFKVLPNLLVCGTKRIRDYFDWELTLKVNWELDLVFFSTCWPTDAVYKDYLTYLLIHGADSARCCANKVLQVEIFQQKIMYFSNYCY